MATEKATKRNAVVSAVIDAGILTITVPDVGVLTIDPASLSPEVRAYAVLHGMKQRIVDAAAIARDESTGLPATPADKFAAMKELADHYLSGASEWSPTRSGERAESGGLVLRALAKIQGLPLDEMRTIVAAKAEKRGISLKAYYKTIADAPAVAAIISELRAAGAKVEDAEKLMGDLMGE